MPIVVGGMLDTRFAPDYLDTPSLCVPSSFPVEARPNEITFCIIPNHWERLASKSVYAIVSTCGLASLPVSTTNNPPPYPTPKAKYTLTRLAIGTRPAPTLAQGNIIIRQARTQRILRRQLARFVHKVAECGQRDKLALCEIICGIHP